MSEERKHFEAATLLSYRDFAAMAANWRRRPDWSPFMRAFEYYSYHGYWPGPAVIFLLLAAGPMLNKGRQEGFAYIAAAIGAWLVAGLISDFALRDHYKNLADKSLRPTVAEAAVTQGWDGGQWSAPWANIEAADVVGPAVRICARPLNFYMPLSGFASPEEAQKCVEFCEEKLRVARSS